MKPQFERIVADLQSSFLVQHRRTAAFGFHWHHHPEFELTLIVRGSGTRFVGDSVETFTDGDLVLLGSDLPHTWQSQRERHRNRCETVYVQFTRDFLGAAFLTRPELTDVQRLLVMAGRGLRITGAPRDRAAELILRLPTASGLQRVILLLRVFEALTAAPHRVLASEGYRTPTASGNRRIDRVCGFLARNFARRIPLAEAARQAHLSPAGFSRFFRSTTQRTYSRYLSELRVGQACRLLAESDLPIARVAETVGFRNLANFNRQFLRLRRATPRQFRLRYANSGATP